LRRSISISPFLNEYLAMIELENVTKEFLLAGKPMSVLKGISVTIQKGEFVSIMGPSGSGKSTLSSILGCLAAPTSGRYLLMGEEVSKATGNTLARIRNRHIGFIFQDFNLLEGISAVENVMLPLFYVGVSRAHAKKRALEKLEQVGLASHALHFPRQLSGGQKQRVAVARALINDPLFLFADEPTGALDSRTGIEIMGLMQQLNAQGHTVVQVTHSQHHCNFGKRILYLVDGLIVRDETVQRPIFALAEIEDKSAANMINSLWRLGLGSTKAEQQESLSALRELYERIKTEGKYLLEAPRMFCRLRSAGVSTIIEELATHPDWAIRAELVNNCKELGEKEAQLLYRRALDDENEWVRFLALSAFRGVALAALSRELQERIIACCSDRDERIRATAVVLLGAWHMPELFPVLEKALGDADGRVRASAIESLEQSGMAREKLAELLRLHLSDANNRARVNAVKALLPLDAALAESTVAAMVHADNNLMRSSACWVLRFFAKDFALPLLVNCLTKEKEENVLVQIIASLQHFLGQGLAIAEILAMVDFSSLSLNPS
jgi:putative ABC transport system ATP-binding protein